MTDWLPAWLSSAGPLRLLENKFQETLETEKLASMDGTLSVSRPRTTHGATGVIVRGALRSTGMRTRFGSWEGCHVIFGSGIWPSA